MKVERGADSSKEILYNPKKEGIIPNHENPCISERERDYPILRKKVGRFLLKDTTRIN